ncbi:phage integrase SAM-like domain-containing protein [uncultured Bacteroides sp.]|uniref:tyrosine-type recombinase/integrase n=1 Tax=uncultured Bacteroides sp. TaxID=162156 RepID=UPI002AA7A09C|nr:phage integrase SAM-like domain-containing protein [uncultured Bacteroides sp.]
MNSITDFVSTLIKELVQSERHGTARSYFSSIRRLNGFVKRETLTFEELTPELLKKYELYLYAEGCKRNSVSLYMRMLRSICNQAVRRLQVNLISGLFDEVFTGTDSSEKRAASPSVIKRLSEAELADSSPLVFARDLFLLSFFLRGIPFVDLAHLRKSDVRMGVLRYRRSKTNRLLTVALEPCAQALFKKYASSTIDSPYLLPIIVHPGRDEYLQYQSALRLYNKRLSRLSAKLKLREPLTSYVARHSWATAAYREGIPVAVISESLGHASEKVTYNYLASFENRTLRNANRKVIALLDSKTIQEHLSSKTLLIKTRNNVFQ